MLYIMRHGMTEWNALKKLQGRTDIPLNEEGIRMAKKASDEYKDINIDICYCSPLIRAKQTAQIVLGDRNIELIEDDRLVEMSFGAYEGTVNYLDDPGCPINVIFKTPGEYTEPIGGSETFDELFARTGSFLNEVIKPELSKGKDILIVGHGAMNLSIICQVKNIPIDKFWQEGLKQCVMNRLV